MFESSSIESNKLNLNLEENKCESLERSVAIDTPNNIYEQEAVEHDVTYYEELAEWRKKPELDAEASPFLTRIYTEDIQPCLNFNNPKVCKTYHSP